MSVTFQDISTNGVRLHVARAGDENGKLVILLHGFPDFWYGWREQIDPLVAAGFHVLIPNQRGYDRSEKPHGVNAIILTPFEMM
ncbi:alpha/beta fold hydrolase [Geomicrobium sp. JCM 19039]|uniref:alpha/beta fold hydrolase n=1 Tax=Geomicrobium sp. JCM 19039 TaxID=1460636 RepID=UPI000AEE7EC8|nr:alpha/beta fold hydrolase [Geomicrobium sp. JCM 19039]